MADCGECTECCELLKIDSTKPLSDGEVESITINSPAGELCNYCEKNVGCKIHEIRPTICRSFECMYIQHDNAPIELRPDRSGVIFEKLDDELIVGTIRPNKTISSAGVGQIQSFNQQGYSVVLTKYDTSEVKIFENSKDERRDVMVKFAKYRRIADGEYTNN